jgi:hypothetical protein
MAATVSVAAAAALLAPASASAAAPAGERGRPPATAGAQRIGTDCVSLDNVTELVIGGTGSEIEVGNRGTYQTILTDASGEQIGTVDADVTVVWQNPADGHWFYYITEEIVLEDGTIRTAGLIDHTAVSEGQTPYISAVGVSGAYRGKIGGRQFEIVQAPVNWSTHIILCGR